MTTRNYSGITPRVPDYSRNYSRNYSRTGIARVNGLVIT